MSALRPRLLRHVRQQSVGLDANAAFKFATRFAMCIYRAGAVYTFIPKNACSTLRYSVALANGCIAGEADVHWIHANNGAFKPSLGELARAEYAFVLLRDPFSRLASCYLEKIVDLRQEAHAFCVDANRDVDLQALTFRQFVRGLRAAPRADIHWRPQVDFLVYEDYDDWFCVEDFAQAVGTLQSRIGFEVCETRHLLRHSSERFRESEAGRPMADVPAFEHAAMKRAGTIAAHRELYDPELVDLARSLYAEDIELYAERIGRAPLF